jgi:antitoxin FitA
MAQLIVRKLEAEVVHKLRARAAAQGISMEEEHRRILRRALLGARKRTRSFKQYLAAMPDPGDESIFAREHAAFRQTLIT